MATKAEQQAAQAAKAAEDAATIKQMTSQRDKDKRQRPERHTDLYSAMADKINKENESRFANLSIDPASIPKATPEHIKALGSPKAVYDHYGFQGGDPSMGMDPMRHQPLPGMDEQSVPVPGVLPRAQRWEDMSSDDRIRIESAAKKFGVTRKSAHAALASQIDRANIREGGKHASFYSERGVTSTGANLPREQLIQSAAKNKVGFTTQAMANAMTSPNSRFVQTPKSGPRKGETVYPNDEAASDAIDRAKKGESGESYLYHKDYYVPPEDKVPGKDGKLVKAPGETRKYPVQGYPVNHAKAIEAVKKTEAGAPVAEAWGMDSKDRFSDPKVGPFHNSWVNPHGADQFWVSDTHSGPAAFAPHLKGKQEDAYMSIPGIHAFHDHIARQVMDERGLRSVTGTQSQHWSQEKYEQGHHSDVADMTPVDPKVSQQLLGYFHGMTQKEMPGGLPRVHKDGTPAESQSSPATEMGGIDWSKY